MKNELKLTICFCLIVQLSAWSRTRQQQEWNNYPKDDKENFEWELFKLGTNNNNNDVDSVLPEPKETQEEDSREPEQDDSEQITDQERKRNQTSNGFNLEEELNNVRRGNKKAERNDKEKLIYSVRMKEGMDEAGEGQTVDISSEHNTMMLNESRDLDDDYYDDDNDDDENDSVPTTSQSLVDSLTVFLGDFNLSHNVSNEADLGDVSKLYTYRRIGKQVRVPQELVDAVDPSADEDLLELIVRIAENPNEWQKIHNVINRLDQALLATKKVELVKEGKEIDKRSSTLPRTESYIKHKKERNKTKHKFKGRRNKHHRHHETKEKLKQKDDRKGKNMKQKNKLIKGRKHSKHKFKNKQESRNETKYGDVKVRHDYNRHSSKTYGKYSDKSRSGLIERPFHTKISYASPTPRTYKTNQQHHYGEWIFARPDEEHKWPSFGQQFKTKQNQNTKSKYDSKFEAKIHHTHDDESLRKKIKDMTRWGMLKENHKNVKNMMKYDNDIRDEDDDWPKTNKNKQVLDKDKILASNTWPSPAGQREKAWPQFSYHRVTSSPSLQQRDVSKHRSAYVAVSAVPSRTLVKPTNITQTNQLDKNLKVRSHQKQMTDLFDHLVQHHDDNNRDEFQTQLDSLKSRNEEDDYRTSYRGFQRRRNMDREDRNNP